MTPFDDLIAGTSFNSPTSGAVCIALCHHSQDGQEMFTDGQQFYKPIESDDGQHLYTDGRQLYAPVCVVMAGAQQETSIGEQRLQSFDPYDPLGIAPRSLLEDLSCWGSHGSFPLQQLHSGNAFDHFCLNPDFSDDGYSSGCDWS